MVLANLEGDEAKFMAAWAELEHIKNEGGGRVPKETELSK